MCCVHHREVMSTKTPGGITTGAPFVRDSKLSDAAGVVSVQRGTGDGQPRLACDIGRPRDTQTIRGDAQNKAPVADFAAVADNGVATPHDADCIGNLYKVATLNSTPFARKRNSYTSS